MIIRWAAEREDQNWLTPAAANSIQTRAGKIITIVPGWPLDVSSSAIYLTLFHSLIHLGFPRQELAHLHSHETDHAFQQIGSA